MKQLRLSTLIVVMLMITMSVSNATPPKVAKAKARATLFRTQKVIFIARTSLRKNKVFTGHFRRAVMHQRYARILFRRGNFWKSIVHSRYARRLARIAIQKNNGNVPANLNDTDEENTLMGNAPSDEDLDAEVAKEITDSVTEEDLVEMEDLGIDIE